LGGLQGEFMKSSIPHSASTSAATIALICFGCFVLSVGALHLLNPSYSFSNSMAGNYDLGSHEFLIASTFFALGFGSLALVIGLLQTMSRSARSWFGLLLLGIWGVGMLIAGIYPANEAGSTVPHMTTVLIAGIFPVEVEAVPETTVSFIHVFAILVSFLSLTLATILLSWSFRQDERWRRFQPVSVILALMMLAGVMLIPLAWFSSSWLSFIPFNPLFFVYTGVKIGILWLLLTTIRLRFVGYR
jgi:hypothetical protein